jgi:biopolymer transport protein ExbD
MALRKRNKIDSGFSMASMTDLVFLLLIFFMITSTVVSPNALKLLLPQSSNQTNAKPLTTISITKELNFFVNKNGKPVAVKFTDIEPYLRQTLGNQPDMYISLYAEKSVPIDEVVKVMNIAKRNKYKMILATSPEKD